MNYCNRNKEDSYRNFAIGVIGVIIIIFVLALTNCEKLDVGCCWSCSVAKTSYDPQPGIKRVTVRIVYPDSMFCRWTDDCIANWEEQNTWNDTINGVWTEQIAKCRR